MYQVWVIFYHPSCILNGEILNTKQVMLMQKKEKHNDYIKLIVNHFLLMLFFTIMSNLNEFYSPAI
jgi:hypothetical protein